MMRLRDLFAEAAAGLLQRPGRSALTALGAVAGLAALVSILGITTTAGGQIYQRFSVLAATEVTITDPTDDATGFPDDASDRITRLNGAAAAGLIWSVKAHTVAALPVAGTSDAPVIDVVAAEPSLFGAIQATITPGRAYNDFHEQRGEAVAVLGAAAACSLGVGRLDQAPAIFIDSQAFTVVGVVAGTRTHPELLGSVLIPTATARTVFGPPATPPRMIVRTDLGAARLVADQAALALRPEAPGIFQVTAPADPTQLRDSVTAEVNVLFLALAGVCLLIGAFGIANTTLVAVIERTSEIGLRRCLGARRWHIIAQFLTESTILGGLGGLVGTSLGVAVVLSVALAQDWTAVLEPWTVLPAPALGCLVGLLSGLYPATRAAWIEPVTALRR